MRFVTVFLLLSLATSAQARLTSDQQACVAFMNADGGAVAKQQGKEHLSCILRATAGKLVGPAQACVGADPLGLVAEKMSKTTADQLEHCTAPLPGFGYSGAGTVNGVSRQSETDILTDVFGDDVGAALAGCPASKDRCTCQKKTLIAVEKLAAATRKTFLKCKKGVLASAEAGDDILRCITDGATAGSITAENIATGKVGKRVAKLGATIVRCDEAGATPGAFPGLCSALGGNALTNCLDARVGCRICRALGDIDNLDVDCDAFDDGLANSSCVDATVSTTTTEPPTTTTTVPPTFCTPGSTASCYSGAGGTSGIGLCHSGLATCLPDGSAYGNGTCAGEVTPQAESCSTPTDDNCDGTANENCLSLTVEFPGGALGRVQDVANGIDCTDTCTTMVAVGTEVNLVSSIDDSASASFWGWRGPCTGAASACTITVAVGTSVDAVFLAGRVNAVGPDGSETVTHDRAGRLVLRNEYPGKNVAGIQSYVWSVEPADSLQFAPCTSEQPNQTIDFQPQIWGGSSDTYQVILTLMQSGAPGAPMVAGAFDRFTVDLVGTFIDINSPGSDGPYICP